MVESSKSQDSGWFPQQTPELFFLLWRLVVEWYENVSQISQEHVETFWLLEKQ